MYLKEVNKKTAEDFFAKYEHLGNCGLGVWHYALYDDNDKIISVVSFGATNFNSNRSFLGNVSKKYNVRIIQLTRGGTRFDAPKNIPSQILKKSMAIIKERFGDVIFVAYSDTKWNEIGTIYQASNFYYLGLTNPKGQSNYIIDNKIISGWDIRKKYGTRDMNILSEKIKGIQRVQLTKKHLYVFVKTSKKKKRKIIAELNERIQKYPKREEYSVGSMKEIHDEMAKRNSMR